ncbi:Lactoylglutathione lyase, partial [Dysosmobacter welbionis]
RPGPVPRSPALRHRSYRRPAALLSSSPWASPPRLQGLDLCEDLGPLFHTGLDLHIGVVRDADLHRHRPEALRDLLAQGGRLNGVVRPTALYKHHVHGGAVLLGHSTHA